MDILITGMGAVSCLGNTLEHHRAAFASGHTGLRPIGHLWPGSASWAGLVLGDRDASGVDAQPILVGRSTDWLVQVIEQALDQSGQFEPVNVPLYVGSVHGHLDIWQARSRAGHPKDAARAQWDFRLNSERLIGEARRPVLVSTACTSSAAAVGMAIARLRVSNVGMAIVAGCEVMTDFMLRGFESLRALSAEICRPFDTKRDGLNLGEGAAAIVLETEKHLAARGGKALAKVAGYGFGMDAKYLIAPDPLGHGAEQAIRTAFADYGCDVMLEHEDVINTHGTGTPLNDQMELTVIRRLFTDRGYSPAVTATKPLTGHMCGAAGIIEIISSVLTLCCGIVPPINGLKLVDRLGIDVKLVRDEPQNINASRVLTLNNGFGGMNTALLLERVAP